VCRFPLVRRFLLRGFDCTRFAEPGDLELEFGDEATVRLAAQKQCCPELLPGVGASQRQFEQTAVPVLLVRNFYNFRFPGLRWFSLPGFD